MTGFGSDSGSAAAAGGVAGPVTSTDDGVPRFDGATGAALQGSLVRITDAGALALPNDVSLIGAASGNLLISGPLATVLVDTITNLTANRTLTVQDADGSLIVGVATVTLTAQAAAIGTTTLLSLPAAGLYRISYYHEITRAATSSSSTQLTLSWTAAAAQSTAGASIATNVLGDIARGTLVVRVASGSITYSTTYASSGATTMQYGLTITVEKIGQ